MPPPKKPIKKNYNVKQVFHMASEMNARLDKYCKAKGMKPTNVCLNALNDFLTNNNF